MNRLMRNLVKPIQYIDHSDITMAPPATAATDAELFTVTKVPFWELTKGTGFTNRYQDIANIAKVVIHVQVSGTEQFYTPVGAEADPLGLPVDDIKAFSQRKKVKCWLVATYGGNPANTQPTTSEVRQAFTDHYLPFWKRDGSNQYNDLASRGNPRHVRWKNNDVRVIKKFTLFEKNGKLERFWLHAGVDEFHRIFAQFHPGYKKKIVLGRRLIVYNGDNATDMERPTGLFWVCLWPFANDATAEQRYHDVGIMTHNVSARTYFYST